MRAHTHTHTYHNSLSLSFQYLGKTHNYWHGVTLLLEERAATEGELSLMLKEPPPYDGDCTDEILDPLKHVSVMWIVHVSHMTSM